MQIFKLSFGWKKTRLWTHLAVLVLQRLLNQGWCDVKQYNNPHLAREYVDNLHGKCEGRHTIILDIFAQAFFCNTNNKASLKTLRLKITFSGSCPFLIKERKVAYRWIRPLGRFSQCVTMSVKRRRREKMCHFFFTSYYSHFHRIWNVGSEMV